MTFPLEAGDGHSNNTGSCQLIIKHVCAHTGCAIHSGAEGKLAKGNVGGKRKKKKEMIQCKQNHYHLKHPITVVVVTVLYL